MPAVFAKIPIRFVGDAIIGFVVFAGLTAVTLGPSAAAGLLGINASVDALSGHTVVAESLATTQLITSASSGFIAFAMVFATLFAFNFAFIRHLAHTNIPVSAKQAND